MSHQNFWASVIERGDEVAIVLEDDAYLEPGFAANCKARIDELTAHDPDWDVCLLGAMGCAHPKGEHGFNMLFAQYMRGMRRRREISEGIYVPRRPAGTHAYAVSAKGARALARMCPKAAFHIDLHAWSSAHRDLRLYACHPFLAYQTFTDSTIGGDEPGRSKGLGLIDEHCRQPWSHALNEPMFKLGSFIMTPAKHQALMCAATASILYTRSPVVAGGAASLLGSCWALVQCMNRPVSVREPASVPAVGYAAAVATEAPISAGEPPAAEFAMPPSPPPPQPAAA
mmetsp:Transcript_88730/g.253606  ORF Transcript_88730/g.253606 Transcript_88730/m.253606 type:complete len:285 (-) Transcript_88730:72-926(-)